MSAGSSTKNRILDHAVTLAAQRGIRGVSIGALASELGLSKSGLFAHFGSKERLDIALLRQAALRFAALVSTPAWEAPPGAPRFQAVVDRWLGWVRSPANPGGCVFLAAAVELDDQPGPARDYLERIQRDWFLAVARVIQEGIDLGHFGSQADPDQTVFELFGILTSYHHRLRMLRDLRADDFVRRALARLFASLAPSSSSPSERHP